MADNYTIIHQSVAEIKHAESKYITGVVRWHVTTTTQTKDETDSRADCILDTYLNGMSLQV